jgi:hypothetical protein
MNARTIENPFLSPGPFAAPSAVHAAMDSRSGGVAPDIEEASREVVELRVLWGTNVLHVAHVASPGTFSVGDNSEGPSDFALPREALGAARVPLVASTGASHSVFVPRGAAATFDLPNYGSCTLEDLAARGNARPSIEVPGAYVVELPLGGRARVFLASGDVSFDLGVVRPARPVPAGVLANFEPASHAYTAMSAFLHLALVASFAFFMPSMNADAAEPNDRSQIQAMQLYLNTIAEREREHTEEAQNELATGSAREGGTGQQAGAEDGALGTPLTHNTQGRYAVHGPTDNPDPHLARQRALEEIRTTGMVGLLATDLGADPRAPVAAWGRDDALGRDPKSALGTMWGSSIDDAFGANGLGLTGTGEGGGCEHGSCAGIGLDSIGPLGHGAGGLLDGQGIGPGGGAFSHGRLQRAHDATKGPRLRELEITRGGHLPAEVIQRIVRQNFGRFRLCYEGGLRGNPGLTGRVAVKFIIDRNGSVSLASDGGSDLPDQAVVSCVVRAFANLSFPEPDSGIVKVTYPISFSPGE